MYLDLNNNPHKYLGHPHLGARRWRHMRRPKMGRRGGLGTVSVPISGSLVYGSSPSRAPWGGRPPAYVPITRGPWTPSSPVTPVTTPVQTAPVTSTPANPWGGSPPQWQGNPSYGPGGPYNPGGPNSPYGGYGGSGGYQGGYGNNQNSQYGPVSSQNNQQNLALAQQVLATNPSSLTPQQWSQLQSAGLVPSTLPYSSAASLSPTITTGASTADASSAIDPTTGVPYATELAEAEAGSSSSATTALTTTYAGLPLYLWLIIGGGGVYLLSGRRR
jgi:hypothetical protein